MAKENDLVTVDLVQVLLMFGDRKCEQDEPQSAIAIYRLAHAIANRIGYLEGIWLSQDRIGEAHTMAGQLKEAAEVHEATIDALKEFIRQLQQSGEHEKAKRMLRILAFLLHKTDVFYQSWFGDGERALAKFQEMLTVGRQIGDRWVEAEGLNCVGGIHYNFGKVVQGIQEMEEAIRIYEDLIQQDPNPRIRENYLIALNHLAATYSALHLFPQAIERYEKSLKISREVGYKVGEMGALWGIGTIHFGQGNFKKAIEYGFVA